MNILCEKSDSSMKMKIQGDMTIYHAAESKPILLRALDEATDLDIDLSAVSEIDSAGLQLLLLLHQWEVV